MIQVFLDHAAATMVRPAIAVSSIVSEMAKGKKVDEAQQITRKAVAQALGGLPPNKMHCSNLGAEALSLAIKNYQDKQH